MTDIKINYNNKQGYVKFDFGDLDICNQDAVTEAIMMLRERVSESFMQQIETIKSSGNFLCPDEEINYGDDTIRQ